MTIVSTIYTYAGGGGGGRSKLSGGDRAVGEVGRWRGDSQKGCRVQPREDVTRELTRWFFLFNNNNFFSEASNGGVVVVGGRVEAAAAVAGCWRRMTKQVMTVNDKLLLLT